MAASDDRAKDTGPDRSAGDTARARIGAVTLAAASEVSRYHAQRLAEYRLARWPARDEEVCSHEDDEPG